MNKIITKAERIVLKHLMKNDALSIKEIAEAVNLDRTTVQKAIKLLMDVTTCIQENLSPGGYRYLYKCGKKSEMYRMLCIRVDAYAKKLKNEIGCFLNE